ncbi:MAG TPA: twin-arginine translocase TatA/TatE family subunit [Acidimicrobiales bacterium]|nr:twin-arginine translocase TatA/TatE family subunit [Acidimicrobiales bacterium]
MTANIFGTDSLYVLIIAIVVLFGGSQLPKLAKNAGEAMKEFRKAHEDATGSGVSSSAPAQASAQPAALPPIPVVQAPAPVVQAPAPVVQAAPLPNPEERVTLSRAELDALLADRERRAKAASWPAEGQN